MYFLKVLLKNDMSEDDYNEVLNDEFKRLNDFLQKQFANAIGTLDKSIDQQINPYSEIILLVNNKGELSYEYFKSNVIKKNTLKF